MKHRAHETGGVDIFLVIVIVAILAIGLLGYQLYLISVSVRSPAQIERAERTDTVEFDYIGAFADGRVFGTTIKSVATDNISYPKAPSFQYPANGEFSPILFTIGGSIDHKDFHGMAEGGKYLADSMIGMAVGETKDVVVPPEQGFGYPSESLRKTRSLIEELPQYESMTLMDYQKRFQQPALLGRTIKDPFWQWDVVVYYVNHTTDLVKVRNNPTKGMVVRPYVGWDSKVVEVTSGANEASGKIVVQHLLTEDDAGRVKGTDSEGDFIVVSVDETRGTFVVDYNDERAGKVLYYQITILSITKI